MKHQEDCWHAGLSPMAADVIRDVSLEAGLNVAEFERWGADRTKQIVRSLFVGSTNRTNLAGIPHQWHSTVTETVIEINEWLIAE